VDGDAKPRGLRWSPLLPIGQERRPKDRDLCWRFKYLSSNMFLFTVLSDGMMRFFAHSWLVSILAEIISEVRGALGIGVEFLTDPSR
jgi:hypothetical protein